MTKTEVTIERIIGKLDNDFNLDNSDWIPRIGAWTIDALSILRIGVTKRTKSTLCVEDTIVRLPCDVDFKTLKVFSSRGCRVYESGTSTSCSSCESSSSNYENLVPTINENASLSGSVHVTEINDFDNIARYNVEDVNRIDRKLEYFVIDSNKIQLSFDDNCVMVEYDSPATIYSDVYGQDFPAIPNVGLVIEAISSWCCYKMLTRGYKHPVLNLTSNNPAINPYLAWIRDKDSAKTAFILEQQKTSIDDSDIWNSSFYIYTFN